MTGPIVRTLLYKEALRYRYNWGLLVMVGALLTLASLVSISARVRPLPGQAATQVDRCVVFAAVSSPEAAAWAAHLRRQPPPPPYRVEFDADVRVPPGGGPSLPAATMAIELIVPPQGADRVWRARYWHGAESSSAVLPYRDWFTRETRRFLKSAPLFEEETRATAAPVERTDRTAMIITALVVFALYLPSFSLYVATTGDEREKRLLLALLLTPATVANVVAAKAIFYVGVSVSLASAVVAVYEPTRLLNPLLWSTVLFGALAYFAMGTLVIGLLRRQATLSTASMLYLIGTSSIMILSGFLPLFGVLRHLLVEDYLYRQMHQILSGHGAWWTLVNQAVLIAITLLWSIAAVAVVRRQGMGFARSG